VFCLKLQALSCTCPSTAPGVLAELHPAHIGSHPNDSAATFGCAALQEETDLWRGHHACHACMPDQQAELLAR
jgi:hypothetical protein